MIDWIAISEIQSKKINVTIEIRGTTHFQCGSDMYIIMHLCSGHAHATDLIENIHYLIHSCYNFILFQHGNGTQKSNFIFRGYIQI